MSEPAVPPPVTLPTATIQDDFTTVLSEVHAGIIPSENIWLSCYKDGEPSIHGKVAISLHEQDRDRVELTGVGGVELTRTSQFRYTARCSGLGIDSVEFISPTEIYADPSHSDERYPHQIPSFAISDGVLATALLDGTVSIYNLPHSPPVTVPYPVPTTHALQPIVSTKLHKSVINALEIISGTSPDPILASAGSDFTIHLSPLSTSSTASISPALTPLVSPKGHTRPVTALLPYTNDTLLSASKDGSLRMWDIRSGAQKATWALQQPAVALAGAAGDPSGPVWVALADGSVQSLDTRASTPVTKLRTGAAAARTIAVSGDGREIALGSADGTAILFDVHGGSIRRRWRRGGAPIVCVSFAPGGRVVIGGEDGLPHVIDFSNGDGHVSELVFGNVEAARALRVSEEFVYIAGDGGVVRKYEL